MNKGVLVAYATKYGATAEIAEKIGQVLSEAGLSTEVIPADRARDPGSYKAVVLGSAVYIGRWRKEAVRFLQRYEAELAGKPVWLFSSGPAGQGDPVKLTQGWIFPEALRPITDRIQTRDITLFHGVGDRKKLNWLEKRMMKMVGSPTGDFRDWEAIGSWASGIADAVKEAT